MIHAPSFTARTNASAVDRPLPTCSPKRRTAMRLQLGHTPLRPMPLLALAAISPATAVPWDSLYGLSDGQSDATPVPSCDAEHSGRASESPAEGSNMDTMLGAKS